MLTPLSNERFLLETIRLPFNDNLRTLDFYRHKKVIHSLEYQPKKKSSQRFPTKLFASFTHPLTRLGKASANDRREPLSVIIMHRYGPS